METKQIRVMASLSKDYQKAEVEFVIVPSADELPGQASEQAEKYCLEQAKQLLDAELRLIGTPKAQPAQQAAPAQAQVSRPQYAPQRPYPAQGQAHGDPNRPVSQSQLQFLCKLGWSGDASGMTSGQASALIDQLKTSRDGRRN